ncbi:unnamed protein product [Arctogadus glacialis]
MKTDSPLLVGRTNPEGPGIRFHVVIPDPCPARPYTHLPGESRINPLHCVPLLLAHAELWGFVEGWRDRVD